MSNESTIQHCFATNLGGGGIETYVDSLVSSGMVGVSKYLIASLDNVKQSEFKLLHLHSPELLWELTEECSSIFTLHNHSAYCPSGTKYLADRKGCCDRPMSYLGCSWGVLVDGCGSRRPKKIINNLLKTTAILDKLKKLGIPTLANSDYVRAQLIKNGLPPGQTVTLRCASPMPKMATAPLTKEIHQNQRILFAGRIVPDKGLGWLLKALAKTKPQIHLDIAGEGWDRPRMEKLANQLEVSNRVTWHGWCNTEQLETLYQQCFAVIFPSVWPDPAGLITLEANARYRPVIASAVGGIPEYLRDGETGILVPSNDADKLTAAIDELATDYQKSRGMGERGQALFLEEFTIDIHVKRLQEIYEKTMADFETKNHLATVDPN